MNAREAFRLAMKEITVEGSVIQWQEGEHHNAIVCRSRKRAESRRRGLVAVRACLILGLPPHITEEVADRAIDRGIHGAELLVLHYMPHLKEKTNAQM